MKSRLPRGEIIVRRRVYLFAVGEHESSQSAKVQSRGDRLVGDVIEKDFNTARAAGADR
jgi:hypothetical protein